MFPFRRLEVWQRAHKLAVGLLADLAYGDDPRARIVAEQAWRAATSISANIAEGAGSASHAQFARFLGVAIGSAHELENHLLLAVDTRMISRANGERHGGEVVEIKRMLWALRARVRSDPRRRKGGSGSVE